MEYDVDDEDDMLNSSEYQPRTAFDRERIRELADSIAEHGLLQPITVHETMLKEHFGTAVEISDQRTSECSHGIHMVRRHHDGA